MIAWKTTAWNWISDRLCSFEMEEVSLLIFTSLQLFMVLLQRQPQVFFFWGGGSFFFCWNLILINFKCHPVCVVLFLPSVQWTCLEGYVCLDWSLIFWSFCFQPLVKFKSHLYFEEKDNVQDAEKMLKPLKGSLVSFGRARRRRDGLMESCMCPCRGGPPRGAPS